MAGISKRTRGSWVSSDYGVMKTATDTITTLPAVLYPNDTTATVGLKGNMSQTGTPTPDNPVMPEGCGERTAQLFDKSTAVVGYGVDNNSGNLFRSATLSASDYINISGASYIRAKYITSGVSNQYGAFYDENKTYISGYSGYSNAIAVPQNAVYTRITVRTEYIDEFMLNTGSTPLNYEPYGYKLDISSASTTTPVYLGEVESTRKIWKLVLTGQENWTKNDAGNPSNYLYYQTGYLANKTCVCSHLEDMGTLSASKVGVFNGNNVLYLNFGSAIINAQPSGNTVAGLKEYLAAQYAAGTPVTVWYVLATPTTGIVNEPLMKIGDYADTLSNISIPVTAGVNTLSVDTTVQPSEVSATYKGWHPVQSAHEKSMNLFDKSKRTDNSRVVYTTGEVGALDGIFVSDFTPIEPNATYTLSIVSSISGKTRHLFALYDENKNFVNTGAHETTTATVYTFTTPSNVAYIRFNGNMVSVDETMLNTGSTALPYEPFWN